MTYETIKFEKTGSFLAEEENIGVITLNRPAAYNAFSPQVLKDLDALLDEIDKDDEVRVVVITAEGEKAFSAGMDLKTATTMKPEDSAVFTEQGQKLFQKLEKFSKPTIAAINGIAFGGGLEIALACDIRIASETAKLGTVEVGIGLIPAWGGCSRLAKIVGMGRAKEMILTGGQLSGKEAEKIGLVNKAVPFDELESTWEFMASKIAGNAPLAVQAAKQIVNISMDIPVEEGNKAEYDAVMKLITTEDLQEGIKSVFEKRKGQFKGK